MAAAYESACKSSKIKPNSDIVAQLSADGLTSLVLKDNYCGTENGFACLLQALKSNTTLSHIDLSGNHLTSENIHDLCEVLLKHPSVSSVTLLDNRLFIESGLQLVRLARFNSRITDIVADPTSDSPHTNHIPEHVLMKVNKHLEYNRRRLDTSREPAE